jgi:hypothetical protein
VVGHGLFSLCAIHKEGMCLCHDDDDVDVHMCM